MNRPRIATSVVLAVSLIVGPTAATAAHPAGKAAGVTQAPRERTETRLYSIRYADLNSAYTLVETLCQEAWRRDEECAVEALNRDNRLAVIAAPPLHERITGMLDEIDRPPLTQSFHVVVLAAGRGGGETPDLPSEALAALQDVSSFLPYDSFRVLDSGWLRTASEAQTTLSGPSDFRLQLQFRGSPETGAPLLVERFLLFKDSYRPDGELTRSYVVETSFTLRTGETVVVGTSKLDGSDTALVVLVTAPS